MDGPTPAPASDGLLAAGTAPGRWVLAATVVGSGMAFLDATVVNVALPHIGEDLDAYVAGLQWVLNGYLVVLSALILLGGSLGDRIGRRRTFQLGVVVFALASAACALAPSVPVLVLGRVVQGVGGALLTPGSLAILEASFRRDDRSRMIGAWSGLAGVASAVGPFAGGWLVDALTWRAIFLLNLPLAAFVVLVAARHVPETRNPEQAGRLDVPGALLIAAALGALSWSLIAAGDRGWTDPAVVVPLVAGLGAAVALVVVERRRPDPLVPPELFTIRQFQGANLVTIVVYAALGGVFFLLVVQLQEVLGYSAVEAGAATLPITLLMLAFSAQSGQLAQRIGPRAQMTVGPLVVAVGMLLLTQVDAGSGYLTTVLPAVVVVGLGLTTTVAPLTSTALAAVDDRYAGVASGVNTTVSRAAQLAAVAALPLAVGLTGDAYQDPVRLSDGFSQAMVITAVLAASGGVLAFALIRNPAREPAAAPEPAPNVVGRRERPGFFCGVEGPRLDTCPSGGERVA
ncbi:MAG TPA: MFS transporter [Acidimicrobiales bacterium]